MANIQQECRHRRSVCGKNCTTCKFQFFGEIGYQQGAKFSKIFRNFKNFLTCTSDFRKVAQLRTCDGQMSYKFTKAAAFLAWTSYSKEFLITQNFGVWYGTTLKCDIKFFIFFKKCSLHTPVLRSRKPIIKFQKYQKGGRDAMNTILYY